MPLSIWLGLEDCLALIVERRPRSVLDAGLGFGLWGHLLRQYLDVWAGRIQPSEWQIRIDGIEIAEQRVQPHARQLYSNIYIGDIRAVVAECASRYPYDVILFGDVLEHLPKDDAHVVLKTAVTLAQVLVVARIPLGDGWREQGREPADDHRSRWSSEDFAGYRATVRQYDYYGNPYALVAIEPAAARLALVSEVGRRLERIEQRLARVAPGSAAVEEAS